MKKLFYYTDVLPLLSQNEVALKKMRRNLEIFKDARDSVHLIWHPWSKTEEYLRLNGSRDIDEYLAIVHKYCEEGWGDIDKTVSYQETKEVLLNCDAYYGDVSDLAYEAQIAKMPVMLQNFDV